MDLELKIPMDAIENNLNDPTVWRSFNTLMSAMYRLMQALSEKEYKDDVTLRAIKQLKETLALTSKNLEVITIPDDIDSDYIETVVNNHLTDYAMRKLIFLQDELYKDDELRVVKSGFIYCPKLGQMPIEEIITEMGVLNDLGKRADSVGQINLALKKFFSCQLTKTSWEEDADKYFIEEWTKFRFYCNKETSVIKYEVLQPAVVTISKESGHPTTVIRTKEGWFYRKVNLSGKEEFHKMDFPPEAKFNGKDWHKVRLFITTDKGITILERILYFFDYEVFFNLLSKFKGLIEESYPVIVNYEVFSFLKVGDEDYGTDE